MDVFGWEDGGNKKNYLLGYGSLDLYEVLKKKWMK